jgi:hypothetical protein
MKLQAMTAIGVPLPWPSPSMLRIAIPAFRFLPGQDDVRSEPVAVSRDELTALFRADLRGGGKLTEQEQAEQDRARRIRAALYSR